MKRINQLVNLVSKALSVLEFQEDKHISKHLHQLSKLTGFDGFWDIKGDWPSIGDIWWTTDWRNTDLDGSVKKQCVLVLKTQKDNWFYTSNLITIGCERGIFFIRECYNDNINATMIELEHSESEYDNFDNLPVFEPIRKQLR